MPLAHYSLEGRVAHIQMDDGKANALSDAMLDELGAALARAEKEAGAIVLSGRPERFCAGFDLKVMMSSPSSAQALVRRGADVLLNLYGCPLPVVAACTGHAMAAGAIVLLASDVRIGAAGAFRIGLNEVSIGLPLPVLGMELARDRLAIADLGRSTLRAQIYEPVEAARVGYLDEVVPAADVTARAKLEATQLATLSSMAYRETKKRLRGRTIQYVRATLEEDMATLLAGV
jgi:enoyl-CoA hydratase